MRTNDDTCPDCGGWKREEYPACYKCNMKASGKKLCQVCGDRYHDPKWNACYACNQMGKPQPPVRDITPDFLDEEEPPLVFLDTETTGLANPRLVQLAYVVFHFGKEETEHQNFLFKPPVPIEEGAALVHGIKESDVADLAPFAGSTVASDLQELLLKSVMVCHNAEFDNAVLTNEGIQAPYIICTYRVAKKLLPFSKNHKLQTLRMQLNITVDAHAHDALGDILVLTEVFKQLFLSYKQQSGKSDVEVINDFIRFSR